jgi:hypothetical protein
LSDTAAVLNTKKWISFDPLIGTVTILLVYVFKLNKKRKRGLIIGFSMLMMSALCVTVGYYFRNLTIAKLFIVFTAIGAPISYSTLYLYMKDLAPHNIYFIGNLAEQSFNVLFSFILPKILKESTTYEQCTILFASQFLICAIMISLCAYFLIETDEKTKTQIYRELRVEEDPEPKTRDSSGSGSKYLMLIED